MDYFHVKLVHHVGTGAKNTCGKIWIKNGLEGNNSTLVRELESYEKRSINKEAERKISKVPTILRGVEKVKDCYDPRIVAIGPYHHDNVNLKEMETFKIQLTLQYANQSGKSIEELYKEMEKWLIDARNYYVEDVVKNFDNKKFVDMMFLDSCFVIQFIYICLEPAKNDIRTTTNSKLEATTKKTKEPIHLLELVQTKFVDDEEIKNGTSQKPSSNWCSYRSVKELKSVGIYLQPSKKSCRFSDITFHSTILNGKLSLPGITIEDGTKSLLLNLVAFEACADTLSNFGVSSYVYFMDTLIDHADDVKELRYKGIILNLLGSDQ
ncbi:uncharacterized protein LOC127790895 [Diospyros lotus]|uniref:uncharacterized protein LOC127790895 n=1 Tax=Diospyros lotus TaxID=55363 RepID=UPI002257F7AC|nr:uncharacterized protein LOC127790895 [Diospyros lotus]